MPFDTIDAVVLQIGSDEPYLHNAYAWNFQVTRVVRYARDVLAEPNYLELKYEELCAQPASWERSRVVGALSTLGYRVTGPNGVKDPDIGRNVYAMAFGLVERFDAFQDNPWPIIYKELDKKYPGSKFVLSVRTSDSWIKNQVGDFGTWETPMRKWIYGVGCRKATKTFTSGGSKLQQGCARVLQASSE